MATAGSVRSFDPSARPANVVTFMRALMRGSILDTVAKRASTDQALDAATGPTALGVDAWSRTYRMVLRISDTAVVTIAAFAGLMTWQAGADTGTTVGYIWASLAVVALWLGALSLTHTRSNRVTGSGSAEFKRIWDASIAVAAAIGVSAVFAPSDYAKGALLVVLPLGYGALVLERMLCREWLKAQHRKGVWMTKVLLVGTEASIAQIEQSLSRRPEAGYDVVARYVPTGDAHALVPDVRSALAVSGADTVIVAGADDLSPDKVREIGWTLAPGRQHLMLAPNLTEVAGPRIHARPVCGLPLVQVETPRLQRTQRLVKRTFDLTVTGALVTLLAPVLLGLAAVVKLSSAGPVFYRQQRIGLHGETFTMLKFRSMRQDADRELQSLMAAQGTGTEPLFKIKDDPRITRVGRILRKYSLDELPQLLNVLGGSMSLVGPRPQIAEEVAMYTTSARRRLFARPGLTGLWQVSGRSSLSWDDAVRLDLYYVENWSLSQDLAIMMRTFKAVAVPGVTAS